ncbi:MAG: rRNA maturation RNase YbeY [Thermodesulfobacteriota bacterium]|nr:rRNA maturation RNase YbeY [Thermodesulfobacteriota bacterium]
MEILIEDRQDRHTIDHEEIRQKARLILEALGSPEAELSLFIVGDQEMADLNNRYLGRSGPTNVMAFAMHEGPFGEISPNLLGDVAICVDAASREARDMAITTEVRFDQLLIHGILHLFGFDHEKERDDAEAMTKKEEQLMKLLQQ